MDTRAKATQTWSRVDQKAVFPVNALIDDVGAKGAKSIDRRGNGKSVLMSATVDNGVTDAVIRARDADHAGTLANET